MKSFVRRKRNNITQQPQDAMQVKKEKIRIDLLVKSRELLQEKGLDFLTARKLADYSGYSGQFIISLRVWIH